MSANDILDVLNIQRDTSGQPAKKKAKASADATARQSGMARELYNLLGPNTPPVNLTNNGNTGVKDKWKVKATPWTKLEFNPKNSDSNGPKLYHWVRGSKELLEDTNKDKPYFFSKFNTSVDIPELVDETTFDKYMVEIGEAEAKERELRQQREKERERLKQEKLAKEKEQNPDNKEAKAIEKPEKKQEPQPEPVKWTYDETRQLFDLCKTFELKWPVIFDRFSSSTTRSLEDLKEQFYRICKYIYADDPNSNPSLTEALGAYSKTRETERKQYLERLLKRTPAEIAEEESLVIEARRFELAAKKMLLERSNLLTLLDSPQTSQSVQQYQSSQGLTNLYNNLMIMDKNQKKRQLQGQSQSQDPVPPPIPLAASSSIRKERTFQTHLQQYLSTLLKQNQAQGIKGEPSAIHKLLMRRLTAKEEEAFGLHYHANEKLTPGVVLRSSQRLQGLQQRQSVLKSVANVFAELDIPTAGGTSFRPLMPTRKTMAKYDELLRSVVALLEVKKGRDKLEAEIELIRSQRGLS